MKSLLFILVCMCVSTLVQAQTWQETYDKGKFFYNQKDYKSAIIYFEKALPLAEKEFGKENQKYATTLDDAGFCYKNLGFYDKAEPLYLRAEGIRKRVLGKEHPDYATSYDNLAGLYVSQGLYDLAEPLFIKGKNIREKALGKENADYATSCNTLAHLYWSQELYAKAEPLFIEGKNIRERVLGKEHPDYAQSCNNVALLYNDQGLYAKAEPLYLEAKSIWGKALGKDNVDYAIACHNLALLLHIQGLYAKAEPLYLEAKNIWEKALGKEHPNYAICCNCLANLYNTQGLYGKAEPLYLEGKSIQEKILGKNHPDYATSCNSLATLYQDQGLYAKAEPLYIEAKSIWERVLGKENPSYAFSCTNLASLYNIQELYAKAEPLCVEAKNIFEKVFGKENLNYAFSCSSLASLYNRQELYTKAEPLYLEAKNIHENILGKESAHYANSCNNLANLYNSQSLYTKAEPLYLEGNKSLFSQIDNNFSNLSEKEKAQFYQSFAYNFEIFNSFSLKRYKQNPAILSETYNNQLATKALLFNTGSKIKERILSSKDQNLTDLYANWKVKRENLAKVFQMSVSDKEKKGINQAQLETEANMLEKELSSKSELFSTANDKKRYTWQDIQKQLKTDEVAIEMIRTQYYGKKWTDSVIYMALIIKKDTKNQPEMVVLANGKELETDAINYYRNNIRFKTKDKFSYNSFWKPIKSKIGTAKKVYFSADGVYHQLNLLTLQNPETGKYVSEETNIQLLSNTKDLVLFAKSKKINKNLKDYKLHLFGFPDYTDGKAIKNNGLNTDRSLFATKLDTTQRFFGMNGSISTLPGTKTEVENIGNFAKNQKIETITHTGEQASEANIKKLSNPDILHIATHGFFLSDLPVGENDKFGAEKRQTQVENPLLRCGLLLADAENGLKNGEIEGKENGVLTAQEAMNLNLDNTDLVVMSACETGLGEIINGEGVFGLQRAFQQAGAKTILMSLWKVDDAATQEMMSLFYENILTKKLSKREAFTQAQRKLKEKYPSPYFWGAFVMVGE